MMMKLTVAFLASLATADAAHGRRHVRRQNDYGYGNGYGYGGKSSSSSVAFPLSTGVPSVPSLSSVVVDTPVPSSTALPVDGASSSLLPSGPPALTGGFEYPHGPSGSVFVPGPSGSGVLPPPGPSGTGALPIPSGTGAPVPSSAVVESASVPALPATTAAPLGTAPFPSGTGTGVSPPLVTGISNGTVPGEGEYTITTTILSTQIFTLTVTVPGQAEPTTSLITSVVAVPSVCTKTSGVPDVTDVAVSTGAPVSEVVHVTTETLTYTVGVGSTAHAVTTEIVQTSTETIYKTIVITAPGYPVPTNSAEAAGSVVPVEGPSGTTVISSTSTTTKFITVYPTPAAPTAVDSEGSVVVPVPTGANGQCAPPTTETITVKETVTVTAGQEVPATTEAPLPATTEAPLPATSATLTGVPSGVAVPTAPFPLFNSTVVAPASTGFVTFTKPVGPSGTAPLPTGPAPTGPAGPSGTAPVGTEIPSGVPGTSGLPSFALPSEVAVPTSTALPVEAASSSTSEAAPASTSDTGYSYGSYRKRN